MEKTNMWKKRKIILALGTLLSIISISCYFFIVRAAENQDNYVINDRTKDNKEIETVLPVDSPVNISVYTYSGEVYNINGYVNHYPSSTDESDVSIEMNGTLELQKMQNEQTEMEKKFSDAAPFSLLVHTPSGEIYGFQSFHEVFLQQENNMELYGYVVGYYDGEKSYS